MNASLPCVAADERSCSGRAWLPRIVDLRCGVASRVKVQRHQESIITELSSAALEATLMSDPCNIRGRLLGAPPRDASLLAHTSGDFLRSTMRTTRSSVLAPTIHACSVTPHPPEYKFPLRSGLWMNTPKDARSPPAGTRTAGGLLT